MTEWLVSSSGGRYTTGSTWLAQRQHARLLDGLHAALDAAERLDPLDDPRGHQRIRAALIQARLSLQALAGGRPSAPVAGSRRRRG